MTAPISGTIMEIDFIVGETGGASTTITIADLESHYLEISLDETDWDKIELDYEVEVIFDTYPDDIFFGRVVQIDPRLTTMEGSSVVKALVKLDESEVLSAKKLVLGSNASVEVISGKAEGVLLVPVEALREISPGEYAVFVIEDGEPKLRMVEVGLIDITYAEIISGLERGDVVSTGIVEVE